MKLTYDPYADALYIYTNGNKRHSIKTEEVKSDLLVDFDKNGKLLGIEILDVSEKMPKKQLQKIDFEFSLEKPRRMLIGHS